MYLLMEFEDNDRLPRRRFLRNAGLAGGMGVGGLGAFGTGSAAGSMPFGSADADEMVDLAEVWEFLLDDAKDKIIERIKNAIGSEIALDDLIEYVGGRAGELLSKFHTLIENLSPVDEAVDLAEELEEEEKNEGGGESEETNDRFTPPNPGTEPQQAAAGAGTTVRTTSPSSPIDISAPEVDVTVPDFDFDVGDLGDLGEEVYDELEDVSEAVVEQVEEILSEWPNPLDLLAEAIDELVDLLLKPLPDLSNLASEFTDGATNVSFDIIPDELFGDASFVPNIDVPIDAWPDAEDEFANVSRSPHSSGAGSGHATASNLQHAAGGDATPIQFKDCAGADGTVIAFPFEFGTPARTQSSVWFGLEPHSPNCLYMGIDPDSGEWLTTDDLLDRRERTHEELAETMESYRAAIDELESFFDETEDGVVVAEHSDLTLRELELTLTATNYLLDQLYVELEELGYAADFDFDPTRYGVAAENLVRTIHEHYAVFDALDPELPGAETDDSGRPVVAPVISELRDELEAEETPPGVDLADLHVRAVRFDNALHELIEEDHEVRLATPRRVREDGTAIHDALDAIATHGGDSATADLDTDIERLAASLEAFLEDDENGLELTDELEQLIDNDTDADADLIEELRALLAELDPDDVTVTFADQLPDISCARCCYSYESGRAVDRLTSAAKWIAKLAWRTVLGAWEAIKGLDSWLKDKLTSLPFIDDFWYRVISIILVILVIIALVLIGWKIGIGGIVAGAGRAALSASRPALVRLLQNARRWKGMIKIILNSDVSCATY